MYPAVYGLGPKWVCEFLRDDVTYQKIFFFVDQPFWSIVEATQRFFFKKFPRRKLGQGRLYPTVVGRAISHISKSGGWLTD